jgi:hypothetical protein
LFHGAQKALEFHCRQDLFLPLKIDTEREGKAIETHHQN